MLDGIVVALFLMWAFVVGSGYTAGGASHLLLVLALGLILVRRWQRKAVG
ncbi:MAG: DUF5670 family protein [Gemmatimonadota bacterium]